ncbi:beta-galactosidase [Butyrivibrio sp. CB08]|uniref:beta-galactosidase n=1 Tax=Butyrivibrio sp. CB08 TaxID=2364879 RepID=UPI000EA95EA3|nr:beta-galactosidase [Butyrivibrio sp. CB08]RKM61285.1 beta-galactosidase [Butyrivibrio sp. CB08]
MKITKDSKVTFDPLSLLVDGQRVFPMMGEMHFSRYPRKYWEEELYKMKAGGIDIVSLYVIWIHHEEVHGEFDFSGDRDLKLFLETVKKCGLYCILRIGPWAHGEARNGGFPDWLLEDARVNGYETRTDAPRYLQHVRAFYEKTYEQAKGFFIKDDGPVIGVQIENEYGHCGGKGGEEGEQHMKTLLAMAKEIGFDAPIYTATGWGGAVTGGMLPVMGGYCEAPWDQRTTEIEPSGNYIFTRERNDHNIGSDHGLGVGITFDMDKFPYLTAELGGGLQVTKHRRPVATGTDTEAMTMVKIASGANLVGYYMYHGGTNPDGKLTTLQESRETGYPNDLPVRSYDFNAPLREYGQMEDTYRHVRLLGTFVHDFGDDLAAMVYTEQPGNPLKPDDFKSLRTAVRYKTCGDCRRGYLFVNNYQRRYEMASHKDAELSAISESGEVLASFGKRDIEDGDFFFYPFNLPVGEKALLTANATPLCVIHDACGSGKNAYVFYTDTDRDINADVTGDLDGNCIITITKEEALHSVKVVIGGREHLIISKGEAVTAADGRARLYYDVSDEDGRVVPSFRSFPELSRTPSGFNRANGQTDGEDFLNGDAFALYEGVNAILSDKKASFTQKSETEYTVALPGNLDGLNEIFANIGYEGNTAKLYKDGKLIADNFYTGQDWEIGLKRYFDEYGNADEISFDLEIEPLKEGDAIYLQEWPDMKDGKASRINYIHLTAQFIIDIS